MDLQTARNARPDSPKGVRLGRGTSSGIGKTDMSASLLCAVIWWAFIIRLLSSQWFRLGGVLG